MRCKGKQDGLRLLIKGETDDYQAIGMSLSGGDLLAVILFLWDVHY